MPDETAARTKPVPTWAMCRWSDHPPGIGAADQITDCCGHDSKGRPESGRVGWY
jgi:hypothetical protein